ncbi:MAG: hypothetical protein WDN30_04000 [Pararobbsia sp.]
MKNLLLFAVPATASLVACSSAPSGPGVHAAAPMIYVQSARQPDDISACLQEKVFSMHEASAGSSTELSIGPRASRIDWLITLTPSGDGSIVKVQHSADASDDLPEPELRFDIARCTT